MKKHILETSFLLLLLSCLAFQDVSINLFSENVPFHTLEDKVEKDKDSKENLLFMLMTSFSIYISSPIYLIVFSERFPSFNYKDKHFRPPIV